MTWTKCQVTCARLKSRFLPACFAEKFHASDLSQNISIEFFDKRVILLFNDFTSYASFPSITAAPNRSHFRSLQCDQAFSSLLIVQ